MIELECSLTCDIPVAAQYAQLALPETALGLPPYGCRRQTLPWLVNEGWTQRMTQAAERIDAFLEKRGSRWRATREVLQ